MLVLSILLFVLTPPFVLPSSSEGGSSMAKKYNYSAAFIAADPPQIAHSWAYHDFVLWMKGRVWDEQRISSSFHSLSYGQLKNLSRKVLAGEPITVVAYGDSVTAKHSGCYPLGQNTSSSSHPIQWMFKSSRIEPWEGQLCSVIPNLAWMTSFLTLLNHTYPSREPHRYINFGSSAATIHGHAESDCQGDFLPEHIDLCIVEHFSMAEDPGRVKLFAETHLHRLFLHNKGPVPVIYLNLFGFSYGNFPKSSTEESMDKCVRDPGRWSNATTCSIECDPKNVFDGEPRTKNATDLAEEEVHQVARHYGLASWSHKALLGGVVQDQVQRRHNLSSCELFSQLYLDSFHPREGGKVLLADVLFYYVSTGIELFKNGTLPLQGIRNVGSPLVHRSVMVPLINCFLAKPTKLLREDKISQSMEVIKAEGWSLVELDGPKKSFKPGWVSEIPGSRLWIKVPFLGYNLNNVSSRHLHIVLTYLVSYENMGQGKVSCVESCTCEPQVVDALSIKETWSYGMGHHMEARLDPGSQSCIVQIQVVESPDKRQSNKFKIVSLQTTVKINMTSALWDMQNQNHQG